MFDGPAATSHLSPSLSLSFPPTQDFYEISRTDIAREDFANVLRAQLGTVKYAERVRIYVYDYSYGSRRETVLSLSLSLSPLRKFNRLSFYESIRLRNILAVNRRLPRSMLRDR